jgi:hypothetical protein
LERSVAGRDGDGGRYADFVRFRPRFTNHATTSAWERFSAYLHFLFDFDPEASTVDEETFVRDIVKHGGVSEHEARDFLGRTMAVHQPFMRVRHPETDAWMICARPR